jgi:pilus assembly protein CpaB
MKKVIPIALAVIAFLIVLVLLTPPAQVKVAVAAADLPMGHVLTAEDIVIKSYPKEVVPQDVLTDPASVVGLTMLINRSQGDMLRKASIGVESLALQLDERAVAINVDNASGFAGLLRAGDKVGISAIITVKNQINEGTYSKVTIENLRVLYLSPEFIAIDPSAVNAIPKDKSGNVVIKERKGSGVVILAVSINANTIVYDFSKVEPALGIKNRMVNPIELLTSLDAADNAKLYLYLMPMNAKAMTTSGLWLPELVILPYQPTPTINPNQVVIQTPIPNGGS